MRKPKKTSEYVLAKLKVVGVGGAGNNAVDRMFKNLPRGVDLIAVNTDVQDLEHTQAKKKIHIGKNITRGLGTGMNPDLGRQAAEENRAEIAETLQGADMIFITAGFGGGTGTGAGPVVAEIAKEMGILTVAIVTKPFAFEGTKRTQIAQEGLVKLKERVDALITIPNDRIFALIDKNTSLARAFEEIDGVLNNAVEGLAELIMAPGVVNVDFADIKAIMSNAGSAIVGIGVAGGSERSVNAANLAINSPLLEIAVDGAKGVLFSVSGRRDLKMNEINEVAKIISDAADQSAKIIFGAYHDRKLKPGQLKVTLVATGFNGAAGKNVFLPNLFSVDELKMPPEIKTNGEAATEAEQAKKENKSLNLKEIKSEDKLKDKKEKKTKEEAEGTWDIPAFLRKKRR